MSIEQRLDFPDYPAVEQERDAEKAKRKSFTDVFVIKLNGKIGGVIPRQHHNWIFTSDAGVELRTFYKDVKEDLEALGLKPRFHCVQNFGISEEFSRADFILKELKNVRDR